MAEPPDLDTLARRYIDLWQEQVAAMAADPEMSELMGRLIQAMTGGPGAMMPWGFPAKQESDGKRQSNPPAAAGTAPARAASDDRDHDVAELRKRLAALETQLARLETDARGDHVASKPARARRGATQRARNGGS
jgi:uncharacterized small protein (DUF1192 family)